MCLTIPLAFYLFGRRGLRLGAQRPGWALDDIEARAVVPQDLTALLVRQREAEKLFDCLRERTVRMRVVARHDKIFRTQPIDDIYRWLLVDVGRADDRDSAELGDTAVCL